MNISKEQAAAIFDAVMSTNENSKYQFTCEFAKRDGAIRVGVYVFSGGECIRYCLAFTEEHFERVMSLISEYKGVTA